jgi:hypothetical protein
VFNIGFLNSVFLFALGAALLPIIIHLLNRRRIRKIPFSSLKFIEEVSHKRMRKLNMRRALILLLRTAAVLLLVIAFARPAVRGAGAFFLPGKAPVTAVICVDNSYSMGVEREQGTVFSQAKEIAKNVVDQCGSKDLLNLIVFSSGSEAIFEKGTHDKELVRKAIANLELSQKATSISGAIMRACRLIRNSEFKNGEIYVVSDFRAKRDTALVPENIDGIKVVLLPAYQEKVDNVSIDRIYTPRKLIHPGEVIKIGVVVRNHSLENEANFPLEIVVDGKRKAEKQVNLSPASSATMSFPFSIGKHGIYHCEARKNRDRLPLDDERLFILEVSKSVPVLIVKGSARMGEKEGLGGDFYLARALSPQRSSGAEFEVNTVDENALTVFDLPSRGVVLWNEPSGRDESRRETLERYVENGGGMAVFLGPNSSRLLKNQEFMRFIGAKGAVFNEKAGTEKLTSFRSDHPAFSLFREEELELLSRATVSGSISAWGVAPDSVLAYEASGAPFMWECKRGKGRMLIFAAIPELKHGNLPLSPMFLPVVHTSLSYLADAVLSDLHRESYVGSPIYFDLPGKYQVSDEPLTVSVDGSYHGEALTLEVPGGELKAAYENPDRRGFYALLADTTALCEVAVNLDPLESDLTPMSLKKEIGGKADVVAPGSHFVADLQVAKQGREIYALFLILAVVALAMESLLSRKA